MIVMVQLRDTPMPIQHRYAIRTETKEGWFRVICQGEVHHYPAAVIRYATEQF